jgi:hypothetical protein
LSWYSEITVWAIALDPKWQEAKLKGIAFSDFAFREMQENPFHENFNLQDNIKDILESPKYPEQSHPNSKFGDPPITLYISPDRSFFLDLYIWVESNTSTHQHTFEGAFTVLQGTSVETIYEFIKSRPIGPSSWGKLVKKDLHLLKSGDLRRIWSKDKMIHRVLHVSKPTISLVLRTNNNKPVSDVQYNYDFGLLASDVMPHGDAIGKLRALSWYLQDGNAPTYEMVESLIPFAELWFMLSTFPKASLLLKKLSLIYMDINLLEGIMKHKLFLTLLKALQKEEDKILLAALEFDEVEWTTWVEKNLAIGPVKAREQLYNAIKSIPWVDEKTLNSPMLQGLSGPA